MIKFEKVVYKNFLSAGDTGIEIQLDRSPTTLVTGTNGVGKSLRLFSSHITIKPTSNKIRHDLQIHLEEIRAAKLSSG